MKVLLIWPPITVYPPDLKIPSASTPIGLAYIAAVLEKNNYEVKILDTLALGIKNIEKKDGIIRTGLSEDEIRKAIEDFGPDLVGISSMFTAYEKDVYDCARLVKEIDPDTPVILGGSNASIDPYLILENKDVDVVVNGEGEITFLELVKSLENDKDIYGVPGTVVRKNGKIIHNPDRSFIQDLDSLPFPARHLLPMDVYFKHHKNYGQFIMRQPNLAVLTSRGCTRKCVYCSIHSVWGHKWRPRSAKNVVDEIEFLVNRYGAKEISLLDDNVSLDKKRMIDICDEIIRRKLDIKWCTPNGIAIWTLNKHVIKKMKESGCYRLTFGIESGNPDIQKFIGKTIKFDRAKELIKYANNIGLWTVCTFILGFPHENKDQIKDTINYAVQCDTDFALFYLLGPFPGTPVHEIFKKEGLLDGEQNWGFILGGGGVNTKNFSREELKELQKKAYSEFLRYRFYSFLNPLRMLRKIRSFEDLRYAMRLTKNAFKMKLNQLKHSKFDTKTYLYGRPKDR